MRIDNRHRIVVTAHLGRADRVKNGGGDVAGQTRQVFIRLKLHARLELFGLVFGERALADDLARHAQRISRHLAVFGRAQVVGCNCRCVFKIRAFDVHRAAAGRVQVADAGREGIEAVQRFAKGVQRQRLYVVFDVRIRLVGR